MLAFSANRTHLIICLLLLGALVFLNLTPETILFRNDFGTTLGVMRAMLDNGEFPILGPPSHSGGRHLGPVYYWYIGALGWLSNRDPLKMVYLAAIFKLLSCLWLLKLVSEIAPSKRPYIGASVLLMAIAAGSSINMFRSVWHSYELWVIICPWLYFAWRTIFAGPKYLPLYLLFSSLTVQFHFSTAPMLVGVSIGVALASFRNKAGLKELYSLINLFWGVLFLATWIPLIIWELSFPSILGKLAKIHISEVSADTRSWASTVEFFLDSITNFSFGRGFPLTLVAALIIGSIVYWWHLLKFAPAPRKYFAIGALIGLALLSFSVHRLHGVLLDYFLISSLPLLLVFWAAALVSATSLNSNGRFSQRLLAGGFCLLWMISAATSIIRSFDELSGQSIPETHSMRHAAEVAKLIQANTSANERPTILIKEEGQGRENAIYLNLTPIQYNKLAWRQFFKELPSFRQPQDPHNIGFLLTCGPKQDEASERFFKQKAKTWSFSREVSLEGVFGASQCKLIEIRS